MPRLLCALSLLGLVVGGAAPAPGDEAHQPVYDLIRRVLPAHADGFLLGQLEAGEHASAFRIGQREGKVFLQGTDNVALSRAFYDFVRHELRGNISRSGSQVPEHASLPLPETPTFKASRFPYRYYLNYVTFNYSMAFWTWEEWEREIDWMAMQGVNLPLAITGTEAVWQATLRRLGFSEKEISGFIPGPAYTAWWLMDNLEGWGGPVSQGWIDGRVVLQRKILARMRALDMSPVLPAFYGMVPNATFGRFPEARLHEDTVWGGFQRPAFIEPADPLFARMAEVFYEEQEKLYGKAAFYSGDPFHEGGKPIGDVTLAARQIQAAMLRHSPGSTWVLQGWQENPSDALLAGTDTDHTMILDLMGEARSMFESRNCFGGRDFVWCNINNFGNNTSMYANADRITTVPLQTLEPSCEPHFKGIGLLPEGTLTDPLVFELFFDMAWEDQGFRLKDWLREYADSRYGRPDENLEAAVALLGETVYNAPHRTESILCARPSLAAERVTTWGPMAQPAYDQDKLIQALKRMLAVNDSAITRTPTYRFDLANVARQVVTGVAWDLLQQIRASYESGDLPAFQTRTGAFLDLILLTDSLVAHMPGFSFYDWQKAAMAQATTREEADLFLWNANRLVTLWANEQGSRELHDYAYREWYGLLAHFYHPRWALYFDHLTATLQGQESPPPDFPSWEDAWCTTRLTEPAAPPLDLKEAITRLITAYDL